MMSLPPCLYDTCCFIRLWFVIVQMTGAHFAVRSLCEAFLRSDILHYCNVMLIAEIAALVATSEIYGIIVNR